MQSNLLGRFRVVEIALGGVEDHGTELFPGVSLSEDALADGAGAEAAVLFLRNLEDEFSHGSRLRFAWAGFKMNHSCHPRDTIK